MKKNLIRSIIAIALLSFPNISLGQVLNLGTLTNFAAYSGTGAVSNAGTSTLIGDIGANAGAISGFNLPTTITGSLYNANATTTQAKIDLLRVYIHLSDLALTNTTHAAAFGSGETIVAGVYSIGGAGSLAGTITLNGQGNPDAAFVIKCEGGFTAAAGSQIILANGARACNVFWIAEGAISIGASSICKGTLIAHPGAVTVAAGSNLEGRMFSTEGAITFGPGVATLPAGPITIPISCVNSCNNNILGTAANFALFTSVGAVANAATSGIIGDIGANVGDISGFTSSTVAGSFYNVNAVTAQAALDLQAAYTQLVAIPTTNTTHTPAFGSGETITSGVYSIAAAGSLAGTITLDAQGNPDALFIFKFNGAFTTAAQSKVVFKNGVRRCNVFWIAEGAVSMGTFTFMKGTLIAHNGANTMGANGNLEGRMLSTTGAIGFSTGVIYNNTMCFADPIAIITAVNDVLTLNGFTGGTLTNVLSNDTLNGVAVVPSQVTTAFVSSTNAGITLSGTNVIVAAGTPSGTYSLIYRICQIANPTNCTQATVTVTVTAPIIAAVNDVLTVNGFTGGTLTNILSNDTLNGVAVVPSQVTIAFVSSTNAGITLSGTNVIVAAGTPAGTYSLVYSICQILNPTNCTQATVSVTVTAPAIAAVNDVLTVNGFTGGTLTNVLSNDTLNGAGVVPSQVTTAFVSSTNAGITLSGTNVIVAAGTPAGTYSLVYSICQILNPTNCTQATVTVTVTAPIIAAVNDVLSVNGFTGGTLTNVLSNDTLNGVGVVPSQVTTAFVSSTNAGITLSGTNVIVAAGTPAGTYSLIYRICQIANPTNCTQATVTVTVTAPIIAAVNDVLTVNGFTGGTLTNILSNDTLNGMAVVPSQVTIAFVSSTNTGITLSGTNVIVAAGTPAGTYSLIYRICQIANPTNCTQATVSVTVTAPAIAAVNDVAVPLGFLARTAYSNILTNDTLNGVAVVASQVTITFVSATNAGITLLGADVIIANGIPVGTYYLTYRICEILNPNNCSQATVTITIQCAPIVAPSISIVQPTCTLATGTITVTSPTGSGFTYSINNNIYQTSPIFTGLIANSYNVTVKNGTCCSTTTIAVVNAAVIPATPKVTVTQPTCAVATGTFTVTTPLGTGLTYSINNSTYQTSPIFTNLPANSYTVTVKNGSCISLVKITVVNVPPAAPVAPTVTVIQMSVALASATITVTTPIGTGLTYSINGSTYQSSPIFSGLTCAGNYTVTVKNSSCTSQATVVVLYKRPPLSDAPKQAAPSGSPTPLAITLAPNPSSNDFELAIQSVSDEAINIRIIDLNGRVINTLKSAPQEANIIRFGNELSSGLYFIEVVQGNKRKVVKAQKI